LILVNLGLSHYGDSHVLCIHTHTHREYTRIYRHTYIYINTQSTCEYVCKHKHTQNYAVCAHIIDTSKCTHAYI